MGRTIKHNYDSQLKLVTFLGGNRMSRKKYQLQTILKFFIASLFISLIFGSISLLRCEPGYLTSDTLTALFIGNSLTGFNQMPKSVEKLGIAAGKKLFCDSKVVAGTSIVDIWNFADTKEKIIERKWDYLVMQGDVHSTAFPEDHHERIPGTPYKPLQPMLEEVKEFLSVNQPETQLIFFMPWAYEDGMTWVPGQTDTYETMQQKIFDNAVIFGNEVGIPVAPVGWAWNEVFNENFNIELFLPDYVHPNAKGSYLAASVFYCVFYLERLEDNTFIATDVELSNALYLQSIASSIVIDNLEIWNLTTTSGITQISGIPSDFHLFQNYPNPFNPSTKISFQLPTSGYTSLKIFNLLGNEVAILLDQNMTAGFYQFDFYSDKLPSGTYFYQLRHMNGIHTKKMIILK